MHKKWFLAAILAAIVLTGCDNPSVTQLKNQVQHLQTQVAKLQEQLDAAHAGAVQNVAEAQSEVNLAFAYQWSGPLQWLPIWNQSAIQQGFTLINTAPKQTIAGGTMTLGPVLQPNWAGYGLLAVILAGLLAVPCSAGAIIWLIITNSRWARRIQGLKREAESRKAALQPLTEIRQEIDAAKVELAQSRNAIAQARSDANHIQKKVDALTRRKDNLAKEIEHAKADALAAYRKELEDQMNKAKRAGDAIDKGLEGL